jgi:hypothetical protein
MATSRFARWAPLTGTIFFVLALLGVLIGGPDSPNFPDRPAKYVAYYHSHTGRVFASSWLMLVAVFFLLWFLGSLNQRMHRFEGGDGRVARLAFGGGVAGSALMLAGIVVNMLPAIRADDNKVLSDDVAVAWGDLSVGLIFIAAPIAFAVLLAGAALLGLRTGMMPAWWSWVTAVVALGLLVIFVSFLFLGLFVIWVLVMSILLLRAQPADAI